MSSLIKYSLGSFSRYSSCSKKRPGGSSALAMVVNLSLPKMERMLMSLLNRGVGGQTGDGGRDEMCFWTTFGAPR